MASDERECRIERIRDMAGRLGNSVAYNWPIRNSEVRDCLVELYYLLGEVERLEQRNHLEAAVVEAWVQWRAMRKAASFTGDYDPCVVARRVGGKALDALIASREKTSSG